VLDEIPELAKTAGVWLVGGAVREFLLGRHTGDLDFAVQGDGAAMGRRVAHDLAAAYYDLDRERGAGRVIWTDPAGRRRMLDFASLRGADLAADLAARDFTVNALAVPLAGPFEILDPTGGLEDLRRKVLRVCRESAIRDDPVRALRGVRLAVDLGLHIESTTRDRIRVDGRAMGRIAPERIRDELVRILSASRPGRALRVLAHLQLLELLIQCPPAQSEFPESESSGGQFDHRLDLVDRLGDLLAVLDRPSDPEAAADVSLAHVSARLGAYRARLHDHLTNEMVPGRPARWLLFLAGLGHQEEYAEGQRDSASPRGGGRSGDVRPGQKLALSKAEIDRLAQIETGRLWREFDAGPPLPARSVYRFFRRVGQGVPEVALIGLADHLGQRVGAPAEGAWVRRLETTRELWRAYWDERDRWINVEPVIRGDRLAEELGLEPGPAIGRALEAIAEAQAAGEVSTPEQALMLAREVVRGESRVRGLPRSQA
jgi:tRNA nucleotidyltransferase/poly(A) polymerase